MADRKNEAVRLMAARFRRWLPHGEMETPEAAMRFLDEKTSVWEPPTRTGNTYALWKGMASDNPDLDWSELKRRADAGFAETRAAKPKKTRYGKKKALSVALAEWPDAFRLPWVAYLNRKSRRASKFDQSGNTTRRSATDSTAEHGFAEFVGAMKRADMPVEVTKKSIQEFIWQKQEQKRPCQPRSIGNLLACILKVARIAGIKDIDWLLEASLEKKAEKATDQKSKRMIEPGDIVIAGMRLIAEARTKPIGSNYAKILFRDGLLLILAAHFPFRRKNLSEARLGHNFIRLEDGRYRIQFSVWEMKKWNDVEYEADLPLSRLIDEFVQDHRPWFVDPEHDAGYLFPSAATDAGQLGGDAILRRFKQHSVPLIGDEVGCHDVRRHVASAMMRKNGDPRAVAAMLQHGDLGSVDIYARLRNSAIASRRMQQVMSAMRGEVARNRRRRA